MNIQARLREALSVGGIDIDYPIDFTEGQVVLINESIGGSTADEEVACVIDISQLKVCVLYAATDLKIETNDGAAPDDTLNLVGDKPFVWSNTYLGDHFTADITALFATNDEAAAVVLEGIFIVDPTV